MTTSPRPQDGILDIALYQAGAAHVPGFSNVVKLSSNENPLGPSEAAKAAFRATAEHLHLYPSSDHADLRAAIGEVHGLDPARIICGAGSDEIIAFLCQAYSGPGIEVIHTSHGFAMYRISALAAGAMPVEVPEQDRVVDVDAILAAAGSETGLVFVANPANPTSTMIDMAALTRLADELPPHVLLVIDGAYAEYVDGYDGGAALAGSRPNVVMTRTFSKLHGLGGLRIGWAYGPAEIIDVLNRVRGPFNLSGTQLATAEAAIRDTDYAAYCRAENARLRGELAQGLAELGVASDTSSANFVLARFRDAAEADACEEALRAEGILVRKTASYQLPQCLRITVGDAASCARVIAAIGAFRGRAK
ncbi:MAG: histidinol-phosphate transaminase [Pseudomonadota bacterium]